MHHQQALDVLEIHSNIDIQRRGMKPGTFSNSERGMQTSACQRERLFFQLCSCLVYGEHDSPAGPTQAKGTLHL